MSKKVGLILVLLALLIPLITMACWPPPPANCSPGFWKNHEEEWGNINPQWQYQLFFKHDPYFSGGTLMEALQGGKDTRVSRVNVTNWLNWMNPFAPCD